MASTQNISEGRGVTSKVRLYPIFRPGGPAFGWIW